MPVHVEYMHAGCHVEAVLETDLAASLPIDDAKPGRHVIVLSGNDVVVLDGSREELLAVGAKIITAAVGIPVGMVCVRESTGYANGDLHGADHWLPAPARVDEDWWDNVVSPLTGDGDHSDVDGLYEVEIVAGPEEFVGATFSWG